MAMVASCDWCFVRVVVPHVSSHPYVVIRRDAISRGVHKVECKVHLGELLLNLHDDRAD